MNDLQTNVVVRFMLMRDLDDILYIENNSFEYPWTKKELISVLGKHKSFGFIIEHDGAVAGYVLAEHNKHHIEILNIATHNDYRRNGVATKLIDALKIHLAPGQSRYIYCYVNECNLQAQLFLRANGFIASKIIHDKYSEYDRDAYYMRYPPVIPVRTSRELV